MDPGVSSPMPIQNKKHKASFKSGFHRRLQISIQAGLHRGKEGREERKQEHRLDGRVQRIGDQGRPKGRAGRHSSPEFSGGFQQCLL